MAWRRPGHKPLSETMMVSLLTHICVTWPQWVLITLNLNTAWKHEICNSSWMFVLGHTQPIRVILGIHHQTTYSSVFILKPLWPSGVIYHKRLSPFVTTRPLFNGKPFCTSHLLLEICRVAASMICYKISKGVWAPTDMYLSCVYTYIYEVVCLVICICVYSYRYIYECTHMPICEHVMISLIIHYSHNITSYYPYHVVRLWWCYILNTLCAIFCHFTINVDFTWIVSYALLLSYVLSATTK